MRSSPGLMPGAWLVGAAPAAASATFDELREETLELVAVLSSEST